MNSPSAVFLQDENAGAFPVIRILLNSRIFWWSSLIDYKVA